MGCQFQGGKYAMPVLEGGKYKMYWGNNMNCGYFAKNISCTGWEGIRAYYYKYPLFSDIFQKSRG